MTRRLLLLALASVALAGPAYHAPVADAAPQKLYLFVHDAGTENQIHRYQVTGLGTLVATSGSPIDTLNDSAQCGGDCQTMAYSTRRKLLFSGGGSGITVTDLSTEPPTVISGSPFGGTRMIGVAVVEKGRNTFVYGAETNNNQIQGFRVTSSKTLEPLPTSPYPAGADPVGLSSIRDLLFAANEDSDPSTISAYKVAANGSLVAASGNPYALPAGTFAFNVDVDPTGRFLYSADCDSGRISAFKINNRTAALTPVVGSPFAVNPSSICSGLSFAAPNLLYAVNDGVAASNIQALRKNGQGKLTQLGPVQSSIEGDTDTSAIDPSGRFLAVTYQNNEQVRLFTINKRTGVLTANAPTTVTLDRANAMLFIRR